MTPSQIRILFLAAGAFAGAGLIGLFALTVRQDAFKHALRTFERMHPEQAQAIRERYTTEEFS